MSVGASKAPVNARCLARSHLFDVQQHQAGMRHQFVQINTVGCGGEITTLVSRQVKCHGSANFKSIATNCSPGSGSPVTVTPRQRYRKKRGKAKSHSPVLDWNRAGLMHGPSISIGGICTEHTAQRNRTKRVPIASAFKGFKGFSECTLPSIWLTLINFEGRLQNPVLSYRRYAAVESSS